MSATDLQRWNGPSNPQELYLYAQTLAGSSLLPYAFRRNPENTFYACEYARALDIPSVVALSGIHVIEGKPTASAGLMSALIRRDGHKLRTRKTGTIRGGDYTVTTELIRSDDPDFTFTATWDLDRALRAGLIDRLDVDEDGRTIVVARSDKGNPTSWEKFTEAMLKARTISEIGREGAEDCLCGIRYTPEELGADVDEDGNIVPNGGVVITSTVVDDPQPAQQWPPARAGSDAQPEQAAEDTAPDPVLELVLKAARETDPDVLRAMYRGAGVDGLNTDITALVPGHYADRAVTLGYLAGDSPITLRQWFTDACSKHLSAQGKSIGDAADEDLALDAAADAAASDQPVCEMGDAA